MFPRAPSGPPSARLADEGGTRDVANGRKGRCSSRAAVPTARRDVFRPRGLRVAVLALVGFLYYQPFRSYLDTGATLDRAPREVEPLRRRSAASSAARAPTGDEALPREARRLGYVKPGERLFIVKGIAAWRRAHRAKHRDDGRPRSRRAPARAAAPRVSPRRRALPFGACGDRAEPLRRSGRSLPDDVLRHVPVARRRDLAARGRGWRRALGRRGARDPGLAESLARATASSATCGAAGGRPNGRRRGASLELGIGGARTPAAQVPARARRLRARAPRLRARREDPGGDRDALARKPVARARAEAVTDDRGRCRGRGRARAAASGMSRTPQAARAQPREGACLRPVARARSDVVLAELRRRVGQTFTLAELADRLRGRGALERARLSRSAPQPGSAARRSRRDARRPSTSTPAAQSTTAVRRRKPRPRWILSRPPCC